MKTAVWLYLFLFVAFFDLHAQYPMLTPFAVSIGAAPSFIGLMMGMYSLTHLPGNLIAGFSVDRYGSRIFIVSSLLLAGVILLFQARVTDPMQLLVLRSISGFVLAFLSPACMALLARISRNIVVQGKLMSGNGLVHTLASVVSPAAGALLVVKVGFSTSFAVLGWILILTALSALIFIRDITEQDSPTPAHTAHGLPIQQDTEAAGYTGPYMWLFFLLPLAISCSQGILFFEVPLMDTSEAGMLQTGILFSVVSIGSLITLSMLFLHRYAAFARALAGSFVLAITFFLMAADVPVSMFVLLLLIGMAKGIIFPAMSLVLIEISGRERFGKMFSYMSIAFSIGAFLGPMLAGQFRDHLSSYYIAFIVLMSVISIMPFYKLRAVPNKSAEGLRQ